MWRNERISRNGHRGKLHTSLETQPEHVPRVKSSQRFILLIHALSIIRSFCRSLISFYLSAFNSFLAIFFLGSSSSILWSNKMSEKQYPPFLTLTPNCLIRPARNAQGRCHQRAVFALWILPPYRRKSSVVHCELAIILAPSSTSFLADSISTIIEEPTIQPVPRKSASCLWLLDQRRQCLLLLCRKF